MNTNRNVSFGSGTGVSGYEVESAMFVPEVSHEVPLRSTSSRSGVMQKLDDLKSRSLSKVHDVQQVMSDRTSIMKSNLQRSMTNAKSSARSGVNDGMMRMQSSMRTSPAKWAGIAAGSGFVLGMLGRLIHARNEHHRHMPQLVVIETSC